MGALSIGTDTQHHVLAWSCVCACFALFLCGSCAGQLKWMRDRCAPNALQIKQRERCDRLASHCADTPMNLNHDAYPASATPTGSRILKVNHAGEHGAVGIYLGQITAIRWMLQLQRVISPNRGQHSSHPIRSNDASPCTTSDSCAPPGYQASPREAMLAELADFRAHEIRHRSLFQAELTRRGVARCKSYALCGIGGYCLGFVTAMLGRRATALTTLAVERVVLRHLAWQLQTLRGKDDAACATVAAIVKDEQQHHDHSARHLDGDLSAWERLLSMFVAGSTEAVIALGMRL